MAESKAEKERRTVRVDMYTFAVYPEKGPRNRIGMVLRYVENDGARTPTGGKFQARRLTVRLQGDDRDWVGQFKNGENKKIILRPLDEGGK